jgi:hypothetical protein
MWAEFEWENKVAISTSIHDLPEFLNHIVKSTNMTCLAPHKSEEQGSFLAANFYARRYVFYFLFRRWLVAQAVGVFVFHSLSPRFVMDAVYTTISRLSVR